MLSWGAAELLGAEPFELAFAQAGDCGHPVVVPIFTQGFLDFFEEALDSAVQELGLCKAIDVFGNQFQPGQDHAFPTPVDAFLIKPEDCVPKGFTVKLGKNRGVGDGDVLPDLVVFVADPAKFPVFPWQGFKGMQGTWGEEEGLAGITNFPSPVHNHLPFSSQAREEVTPPQFRPDNLKRGNHPGYPDVEDAELSEFFTNCPGLDPGPVIFRCAPQESLHRTS